MHASRLALVTLLVGLPALSLTALGQELRRPDRRTIAPEVGPGEVVPPQRPSIAPQADPSRPGARTISDIRIAKDQFGIYNGSNQSIAFSLGQSPDRISLGSHQLQTFPLDGASGTTASIETRGVGITRSTLQRGTLYVIEASGGRWVFSKF